jgi:hypothetical protein
MHFLERQIMAWLSILIGAYFIARSVAVKREKGAMKEILGVQIDKVKFFRNFFLQRLEAFVGFFFVLIGVGIHLYVLVREHQQATAKNDPREALTDIGAYLGYAVLAMVLITILMQWVCSWFSQRIFLDILGYLMVRYRYRIEEDPALLVQIGDILGVERSEDDTVETYTERIEEALKLEEIRARLKARGKIEEDPRDVASLIR